MRHTSIRLDGPDRPYKMLPAGLWHNLSFQAVETHLQEPHPRHINKIPALPYIECEVDRCVCIGEMDPDIFAVPGYGDQSPERARGKGLEILQLF